MPGARPELRPLRRSRVATALFLFTAVAPAAAQDSEPGRALIAAEVGVTRLAGFWVGETGADIALRMSPSLDVGAAARLALAHPTVARAGSTVRLHFGYGGLTLGFRPVPERWAGFRTELLVGAGNADVHDPAVGTLLDSDNGLVVEPSLSVTRTVARALTGSATLSWRVVSGFATLGGVDSRDLRGPTLALGVLFGPF